MAYVKRLIVLLGLLFICSHTTIFAAEEHYGIATPRFESTKAASDILAQGGNAIDAGVAAVLTLSVIQTSSVGIAGYGGSLVIYSSKDQKVYAVDFDSPLPRNYDLKEFNQKNANRGYKAVGAPGVVSGLYKALERHGTLSWKEVSQNAYHYAEEGIVVNEQLKSALTTFTEVSDPDSVKAYLPDGVPELKSVWKQKDLANIIKKIGEEGPDGFYKGEVAKKIAEHIQSHGGYLSEKDLNTYQARYDEPIKINYRGYEIYTPPVPSAGLTALTVLKTLENFDLKNITPFSVEYFTLWGQASKLAWADRFQFFGDPDFVKLPTEELLSDKAGKERAEKIRNNQVVSVNPGTPEPLHTVNVVIVDKEQNIISITATQGNGYGSAVVVPGTGLVFGHGVSRFDYEPKAPNYPQPGKRVQHNMAPVVVLHNGKPYIGLGLGGGRHIVSATSHLLIDLLDHHLTAKEAIAAPRAHNEGDNQLRIYSAEKVAEQDIKELKEKGFTAIQGYVGGGINIAVIDSQTGKIDAASQGGQRAAEVK